MSAWFCEGWLAADLQFLSVRLRADQANEAALLAPGPPAGLDADRLAEGPDDFSPGFFDRRVVLIVYLSGLGDLEGLWVETEGCPAANERELPKVMLGSLSLLSAIAWSDDTAANEGGFKDEAIGLDVGLDNSG